MDPKSDAAGLTWPGMEFPAAFSNGGWVHVEPLSGLKFGFEPPLNELPKEGIAAFVLAGERLAVMRSLVGAIEGRLTLAYLDLPRLSHATFARPQLRVSTWLSMLRSHVDAATSLLQPSGRVVLHVDDEGAALAMLAVDELLGKSNREATILWQKKYGPQSDLRGRIDDAHDYLLVYTVGEAVPDSRLESQWWTWQYAGKSEDGTREAEELRRSGVITLPTIPKTGKPEKLVDRLLEAFTDPGDLVLEAFSDTGFASAAAIKKSRVAILLAGETEEELEALAQCTALRLIDVAVDKGAVAELRLSPAGLTPVKVTSAGSPIELSLSGLRVNSGRCAKPVILAETGVDVMPSLRQGFPPMLVEGPVLESLNSLEPAVACGVTLAYLDWTTGPVKLEAIGMSLSSTARLLGVEGVVAVGVNSHDYPYVRFVGETDCFGGGNYLGTIVLEPSDAESANLLIVFKGLPEAHSGSIGLPAKREYGASDLDPRGPWRDPGHKGARSGSHNTAFEYRLPPYRWELVGGELPPGAWRVNPVSGVVWAPKLTAAGVCQFVVRVTDSRGLHSQTECRIEVVADGRPTYPDNVWWMDRPPSASEDVPRLTNSNLPTGVVGAPYSAVLEADGGTPVLDSTAPGEPTENGKRTRYWEFSRNNLTFSILEDCVLFGETGAAKPRIKKHLEFETATTKVELSWWDHELLSAQSRVLRLLSLFSEPGDLVLVDNYDCAAEVMAAGRRCLALSEDPAALDVLPFRGRLGAPVLREEPSRRSPLPIYDSPDFGIGFPWLLGFLPPAVVLSEKGSGRLDGLHGVNADASEALIMMGPEDWPTRTFCESVAERYGGDFRKITLLYYRGRPPRGLAPLKFLRVPFDLAPMWSS